MTTTPHQPIVEPEATSSFEADEILGALRIETQEQAGIRIKPTKQELLELLRKHAPVVETEPKTSWQVMHSRNW